MPTRVDIGNGYIAEFPDGMSKEDIKAALLKRGPQSAAPVAETSKMGGTPTPTTTDAQAASDVGNSIADTAYAGVQGVARGAFNLGGLGGTLGTMAGSALKGQPIGFNEANRQYEEGRQARAERNPVTSGAGYVAGSLAGGGGLVRGTEAVAPRVVQALTPRAVKGLGDVVRNAGKLATTGAVTGGIQAATEGADPTTGAVEGAIAAPVVAGATRAAVGGVRAVAGAVSKSAASKNAVAILARRIGEDPQALTDAVTNFTRDTGRAPTMTEIVSAGSAAELGKIAAARQSAAQVFNDASDATAAARPATMRQQIAAGSQIAPSRTQPDFTDQTANLVKVRKDAMDSFMGKIGNQTVTIPQSELGQFLGADSSRVLNHDLRSRLGDAYNKMADAKVTVRDIDNMRQAFSDAGDSGQKHMFYDLANNIRRIGTNPSTGQPAYESALREYEGFSRGLKGFQHGVTGKIPGQLKDPLDIADSQTQEYKAGRNIGVRSRLATQAGSTEQGAVSTAQRLAQPSGVATEAGGALSPQEQTRLQRTGAAEAQSADRFSQVSTNAKAPTDELSNDIHSTIERAAAIGGHALTGYKANVASRLFTQAHVSQGTAKRIAELATDTKNLPAIISALRRARIDDDTIRSILVPVAAGAGAAAGDAQ